MIKFSCKNCAQLIRVPEVQAGRRGKCPKCGWITRVPDKSTIVTFRCENCGQQINISKKYPGKRSKCQKCGAIIVIPELGHKEHVTGDIASNNLQTTPTDSDSELSLVKIPEEDRAAVRPAVYKDLFESAQVLVKQPEEEKTQALGKRKLPWIIDILLYPTSIPGLTVLGIVIVIPLLVSLLQILLGRFVFSLSIICFLINVVIGLYLYWYLAECIRDSAIGGLRAPETIGITPGFNELLSQALDIIVCFIVFIGPPGFYFLYTHKTDTIFWALTGYAVFFFPMGLLAVIVFDSFSALNPIVLIGSIFSTFFQYCGLVFLFIVVGFLAGRVPDVQSPVLGFVFYCLSLYLTFVGAHLLGRFYWKYQKKLNWEV